MTADPTYRSKANQALFVLWALFWLAMIVVELQDSFLDHPGVRWWEPVLWEGSSMVVVTLWLLLQRRFDAHYEPYLERPLHWFGHHLKWFPLIALTFIPSIYAIRNGIYALAGMTYHHEPWGFIVVYESVKLLLFGGLWLAIIFGLDSFAQWRSQRERLLAVQKSLAESQLQQLQSQLRPHFLFNALNTISSLMQTDTARADRLLVRLSDLLRASLQADQQELTSLGDELRVLELYALIMQERFVDRVQLVWDIDQQTLPAAVPSLLLQPLLENAFKHGVEQSHEAVTIQIHSRRDGGQLQFAIGNTGALAAWSRPRGIGLRNCRERLRLLYGDAAAITLTQEAGEVWVRVSLPWQKCAAAEAAA
ncbi:MAG TPA: histidine kinase [Povalibacter sp.]